MKTYTPPPWSISALNYRGMYANDGSGSIIDCAGDGRRVCLVDPVNRPRGKKDNYMLVDPERDQIMRLISKAPELLALLRALSTENGFIALDPRVEELVEFIDGKESADAE